MIKNLTGLLTALTLYAAFPASAQHTNNHFSFVEREIVWPVQRPGMFLGQAGDAVLLGGGLDDLGQPSREVFVAGSGEFKSWRKAELSEGVAFAGVVSVSSLGGTNKAGGLVIAGGLSREGLSARVFALHWAGDRLVQTELPPLPQAVALPGVGFFEDQPEKQLYVVGGTTSRNAEVASGQMHRLRLGGESNAGWEELPPVPGEATLLPGVLCYDNDVHLFGGYTVTAAGGSASYTPSRQLRSYRWKVIDGTTFTGWQELAPLPVACAAPVVFQTGQVHAGMTAGQTGAITGNLLQAGLATPGSREVWVYHKITDTWVEKGETPDALIRSAVVKRGNAWSLLGLTDAGKPVAVDMTLRRTVRSLRAGDYAVIVAYFALAAFVGLWMTRHHKGSEAFSVGDRKVKWWAAGISMFATAASSISFMAIPAQAFRSNLVWFFPVLALIPLFFLEAYVIYPLIRRLRLTSTFEYLERRFHPGLRYIASAQCIALQLFARINMVLLLPALAVSAVTGLNVFASVLAMGVLTTIYTTIGGLSAVIWVEVIQGVLMLGGLVVMIWLALAGIPGGAAEFLQTGVQFHKFDYAIWSLDYALPIFWLIVLSPTITKLAFAADQPVVQRVFATPLKDVRKLAFVFLLCSVGIAALVNLAGLTSFAYFRHNPAQLDPAMSNDQVIPLFVVQCLPVGVAGLIIACLFAASMSTLSGSMNSVATIFTEDFYSRFRRNMSDRERMVVLRVVSVFAGVFGTGCALYMAQQNVRSLFQAWNELFALVGGGFMGIYVLGIFTRRTNAIGAATGALASVVTTLLIKQYTDMHWYGYMPSAVFACCAIGYVVSLFTPGARADLTGLTVFDMRRDLEDEHLGMAAEMKRNAEAGT